MILFVHTVQFVHWRTVFSGQLSSCHLAFQIKMPFFDLFQLILNFMQAAISFQFCMWSCKCCFPRNLFWLFGRVCCARCHNCAINSICFFFYNKCWLFDDNQDQHHQRWTNVPPNAKCTFSGFPFGNAFFACRVGLTQKFINIIIVDFAVWNCYWVNRSARNGNTVNGWPTRYAMIYLSLETNEWNESSEQTRIGSHSGKLYFTIFLFIDFSVVLLSSSSGLTVIHSLCNWKAKQC